MSASGPVVVLVGHCGFDSVSLERFAQEVAPGVVVRRASSKKELDRLLPEADALLVNRALGLRFGLGDGVGLIRDLASRGGAPACVLVSNHEDAQREAEAAGAAPGFGKSELRGEEAAQRLRAVLARGSESA